MDLSLSPREKELAARAREFTEHYLKPLELVTEEHGEVPADKYAEVLQATKDWGLVGLNHSKEHGGQGFSFLEQTVIEEQLGQVTNGLWTCIGRPAVCLKEGTQAQIDEFLIPSARGDRRPAVAITEPLAGSDAGAIQSTATLVGDEWVLNGTKWFVTSFNRSDFVLVQANVDGDPAKSSMFIVENDNPGMKFLRSPKFMHNFGNDHAELEFTNAAVSADRLLGEVGQGFELTKDWFVEARLQIACHTVGAAIRAAEEANEFAANRSQFGTKIRDFQAIEFMLADMAMDIFAAKSMLYRVAWEIDNGADRKQIHARASALKLFCSEMAGRVCDKAVQIFGGRGYMREYAVERLYRDVRVDRIWEGTSEIQRVIMAGQIKKRGMSVYTDWK